MSLPVWEASGNRAVARASAEAVAVELVKVRVMGHPEAVAEVTQQLRDVLHVAEESQDYPRRRDLGVRRYLTVVLSADERHPRTRDDGVRTR